MRRVWDMWQHAVREKICNSKTKQWHSLWEHFQSSLPADLQSVLYERRLPKWLYFWISTYLTILEQNEVFHMLFFRCKLLHTIKINIILLHYAKSSLAHTYIDHSFRKIAVAAWRWILQLVIPKSCVITQYEGDILVTIN